MIKKLYKMLISALSVSAIISASGAQAEERNIPWKTEKMKLLDSNAFQKELLDIANSQSDEAKAEHSEFTQEKIQTSAKELMTLLFAEHTETINGRNGIHIETVFTTIGALIGFSSQAAIHEKYVATGKMAEQQAFLVVETKNGETYYHGDNINSILFESKGHNPWVGITNTATALGAKTLPDLNDLAKYSASRIGESDFGTPRLPKTHMPHALPKELLNKYWNPLRNLMLMHSSDAETWPKILSLAAIGVMVESKEVIAPEMATKIIFESAIPMSHINYKKIHNSLLPTKN